MTRASTFAGIILITGLLSGSYPAIYLSGFKPISILKGKVTIFFCGRGVFT